MNASNEAQEPRTGSAPAAAVGSASQAADHSLQEKIEIALARVLNIGSNGEGPLPADATELAMERTYMAAERTLQAWIRTALSLISFGFTIGKLGQAVVAMPGMGRMVGTDSLAYMLVSLGTLALAMASVQHWMAVRSMRARGLKRRPSVAFGVALLLTMLGGFAFSALVTGL